MKKILFVLCLFIFTSSFAQKFFTPSILSTNKEFAVLHNPKILEDENVYRDLTDEMMRYMAFALLRNKNASTTRQNIDDFGEYFIEAESLSDVEMSKMLPQFVFVESYGINNLCSGSGACGVVQFIPSTGVMYGLVGKNKNGKISWDKRQDPRECILAAGRYLSDLKKYFGSDLAISSYHMGEGNMCRFIKLYILQFYGESYLVTSKNALSLVEKYDITWPKIFFRARPGMELYTALALLKDASSTYYFRILAAKKLLEVSKTKYASLCRVFSQNLVDSSNRPPHRYYAWYEPRFVGQEVVVRYTQVPALACKNILAFVGGDTLCKEETIGATLLIGSLFRKSFVNNSSVLQIRFSTQCSIDDMGLHCGEAFDIMTPKTQSANKRLKFILKRLEQLNIISFSVSQKHYHVVISPYKEDQEIFRAVYEEALIYSR